MAGLLTFATVEISKSRSVKDSEEQLAVRLNMLAGAVAHFWQAGNQHAIVELIATLKLYSHKTEALFADGSNTVVASSDIADNGRQLVQVFSEYDLNQFAHVSDHQLKGKVHVWISGDQQWLYGVAWIGDGFRVEPQPPEKLSGTLMIKMDIGAIEAAAISDIEKSFMPYILFVLLAAVVLCLYFYVVFGRRVLRIENAAKQYLDTRIKPVMDIEGHDEIASLSSSLDRLMDQVTQQHSDIVSREKDLAMILDGIEDGVIAFSKDGAVLRINKAAEKHTGWSNANAHDRPITEVITLLNKNGDAQLSFDGDSVLETTSGETQEGVLLDREQRVIDINYSLRRIQNPVGGLEGYVLMFHNVSAAQQSKRLLYEIASTLALRTSGDYFSELVMHLYRLFRTKFVMIGEIDPENVDQVQTLAVCKYGNIIENFHYDLVGTPCESVVSEGVCIYPDKVNELFPQDVWLEENNIISYIGTPALDANGKRLGIIVLLDDKPVVEPEHFEEGLRILSASVAYEIERAMTLKKLEETQQRLVQHIKSTPVAVIEWDQHFKVRSWNPAAEAIFGFTEEEMLGRGSESIATGNSLQQLLQDWNTLKESISAFAIQMENINKYRKRLFCDWYNTPLLDSEGHFVGVASLILDVTKEQKAINEVLKKEYEQREILDSMVDAVITMDEDGTVASFNTSAETMFGYSSQEVVGKKVNMLMTDADKNQHDTYLQRYFATGNSTVIGAGREVIGQHKSGRSFPFRLAVSELPKGNDDKRRFIGCCQDLTVQKQQEEQIRRNQKMESLGKLTGGVAHDFNNILGIVRGYAELLTQGLEGNEKLEKYAREIHRASNRGAKLTKRMLAFSKEHSQQVTLANVNDVITADYDLINKVMTPSIVVDMQLADELWDIEIDTNDFSDAILNLVLNASHAMHGKGRLRLVTANHVVNNNEAALLDIPSGEYVQLTVEDSGEGISQENLSKIFDPFFTTKKEKGTGLGLSQVFGFVKRSRGSIQVYSQVGSGTKMTLLFPRAKSAPQVEQHTPGSSAKVSKGNETILVVDDEAPLRELLQEVLSAQGYQVVVAKDAKEALQVLDQTTVDLMFSDVVMPGMDGYELAAQVAANYPEVKIQLASGYSFNHGELNERYLAYQKNIVRKPYNIAEVLSVIRQQLDN